MAGKEKIAVGCDHAAVQLKNEMSALLAAEGYEVVNVGTDDEKKGVDYSDYAAKVAVLVARGEVWRGVLCCGTGIGMAIAANKFPGVRAAVATDEFMAEMAARHNQANILCLGARLTAAAPPAAILKRWLATPFDGGRHERRVNKIAALERALGIWLPDDFES